MDIATFSQLGIGLATLFILWIVVRYFIEALGKKEENDNKKTAAFTSTINKFNKTINNHINHQTAAALEQKKAMEALTEAIKEMSRALHK